MPAFTALGLIIIIGTVLVACVAGATIFLCWVDRQVPSLPCSLIDIKWINTVTSYEYDRLHSDAVYQPASAVEQDKNTSNSSRGPGGSEVRSAVRSKIREPSVSEISPNSIESQEGKRKSLVETAADRSSASIKWAPARLGTEGRWSQPGKVLLLCFRQLFLAIGRSTAPRFCPIRLILRSRNDDLVSVYSQAWTIALEAVSPSSSRPFGSEQSPQPFNRRSGQCGEYLAGVRVLIYTLGCIEWMLRLLQSFTLYDRTLHHFCSHC